MLPTECVRRSDTILPPTDAALRLARRKTGDKPPSPAVRIRPGTRPPCRADFSRLRDAIADARLYGNVKLETALQPRGGRTAEHEIHRLRLNPPHTHGRGQKRTNGTGFLPFATLTPS